MRKREDGHLVYSEDSINMMAFNTWLVERLLRQLSMSPSTTVVVKMMIEKFYAEPKVVPLLKIPPHTPGCIYGMWQKGHWLSLKRQIGLSHVDQFELIDDNCLGD